ncbi:hypothetical protein [uncultured Corynebacterium sp.]|uniref:hypothetical protein n=1 Tax=uncultured Corynebacterium sp. TaxID=159447 RepID=UPI00259B9D33|nr:hypothetical protein [uncultured Corynebacterium sp.]
MLFDISAEKASFLPAIDECRRIESVKLQSWSLWKARLQKYQQKAFAYPGLLQNLHEKKSPAPTAALRTQPEFALLPEGQSQQVFGALTVMAYLLRVTSPGTSWPDKVTRHIKNSFLPNPLVRPESLGIPSTWFHSLTEMENALL